MMFRWVMGQRNFEIFFVISIGFLCFHLTCFSRDIKSKTDKQQQQQNMVNIVASNCCWKPVFCFYIDINIFIFCCHFLSFCTNFVYTLMHCLMKSTWNVMQEYILFVYLTSQMWKNTRDNWQLVIFAYFILSVYAKLS